MHTPGPWKRCGEKRGGCKCGHVWDATGNVHVASATHVDMCRPDDLESLELSVQSIDEAKANARLIAAAPDLLSALQSLVADIRDYERVNNLAPSPGKDYCWQSVGVAYAAIDKAIGTNS